ncbi:hypothetical protein A5844_000761 [Enterococcus sp. 10A9_DIV0425]|uniref:RelB/DinJ family addiction module antitoxin n=1 Tax=Candidatus Enterococcus wittei TaxID=1987383 RepID=A0A2C9XRQ6_9ENTE|nr:hypothetical protein A5844_000761 [Enterococcus sp. 10A9_DIV0425]
METTKKKSIHISIDKNLKSDGEQLFEELGMNMTIAITFACYIWSKNCYYKTVSSRLMLVKILRITGILTE